MSLAVSCGGAYEPGDCCIPDKGTPMPDIVKKLTIKTGKNASRNPSVASLYRALADTEAS